MFRRTIARSRPRALSASAHHEDMGGARASACGAATLAAADAIVVAGNAQRDADAAMAFSMRRTQWLGDENFPPLTPPTGGATNSTAGATPTASSDSDSSQEFFLTASLRSLHERAAASEARAGASPAIARARSQARSAIRARARTRIRALTTPRQRCRHQRHFRRGHDSERSRGRNQRSSQ